MSDKEYKNNGVLEMIVIGNLKNVKSLTQFFEGCEGGLRQIWGHVQGTSKHFKPLQFFPPT
jgi:hypothetical protein